MQPNKLATIPNHRLIFTYFKYSIAPNLHLNDALQETGESTWTDPNAGMAPAAAAQQPPVQQQQQPIQSSAEWDAYIDPSTHKVGVVAHG